MAALFDAYGWTPDTVYGLTYAQAQLWAERGRERIRDRARLQAQEQRETFIDILCAAGAIKRK
jgi:hypothetical protein